MTRFVRWTILTLIAFTISTATASTADAQQTFTAGPFSFMHPQGWARAGTGNPTDSPGILLYPPGTPDEGRLASDRAMDPTVEKVVVHAALARTPLADAAAAEIGRSLSTIRARPVPRLSARQGSTSPRSWARRHPLLLSALVGFGAGFGIGLAAGDDGVFDDFTASANGVMLGGIGAGAGAAVGVFAAGDN